MTFHSLFRFAFLGTCLLQTADLHCAAEMVPVGERQRRFSPKPVRPAASTDGETPEHAEISN